MLQEVAVGMKPVGYRRVQTGPRLAVFHNITMYILIREYRRAPVWRRREVLTYLCTKVHLYVI